MSNTKSLPEAWNFLSEIRNRIKDRVKNIMGWKADSAFYDRVYGRVQVTPAEEQAFRTAFSEIDNQFGNETSFSTAEPARMIAE